jgi:hypothetical protein
MTETVCASTTSVEFSETKRRYIPEGCHNQKLLYTNVKSYFIPKYHYAD